MQVHISVWLLFIFLIGYLVGAKFPGMAQRVGLA
jgi:hypothetical protein